MAVTEDLRARAGGMRGNSEGHSERRRRLWARTRPVQQPNGVLAVIPRVQTELVQNGLACFPIALLIAPIDRTKILPSRLVTHRNPPSTFSPAWVTS
jgi:hypothetical protein